MACGQLGLITLPRSKPPDHTFLCSVTDSLSESGGGDSGMAVRRSRRRRRQEKEPSEVRGCVSTFAELLLTDSLGWSLPHYAALSEDTSCLEHLYDLGLLDLQPLTYKGETPLSLLIKYKEPNIATLDCLDWLLRETNFEELDTVDQDGGTPIHYATRCVEYLRAIQRIAKIESQPETCFAPYSPYRVLDLVTPSTTRKDPSQRLRRTSSISKVQAITQCSFLPRSLKESGDIWTRFQKALEAVDQNRRTCLVWAVQFQQLESLEWFLYHGPARLLLKQDQRKWTVFHHAAQSPDCAFLVALLAWYHKDHKILSTPPTTAPSATFDFARVAEQSVIGPDTVVNLSEVHTPRVDYVGGELKAGIQQLSWFTVLKECCALALLHGYEDNVRYIEHAAEALGGSFRADVYDCAAVYAAAQGFGAGIIRLVAAGWKVTTAAWFTAVANFDRNPELVSTMMLVHPAVLSLVDNETEANALHVALVYRQPAELFRLLLDSKIQREQPMHLPLPSRGGRRAVTPLLLSVLLQNDIGFEVLLECSKEKLVAADPDQWTISHYVAAYGTLRMLKLLARRGVNLRKRDLRNRRPVDIAQKAVNGKRKLLFLKNTLTSR